MGDGTVRRLNVRAASAVQVIDALIKFAKSSLMLESITQAQALEINAKPQSRKAAKGQTQPLRFSSFLNRALRQFFGP
jgi:hypothetical protein